MFQLHSQLAADTVVLNDLPLCRVLIMRYLRGEKLNIAALGNLVPQRHLHHIVCYVGDLAWPRPVLGVITATPYSQTELAKLQQPGSLIHHQNKSFIAC